MKKRQIKALVLYTCVFLTSCYASIMGITFGIFFFFSAILSRILQGNYEEAEGILDTPPKKHTNTHEKSSDSVQKTNGSKFTTEKPLESITPFGTRKNKFIVQSTLNEHKSMQTIKVEENHENCEDEIIKRIQPSQECTLIINKSQPEPGCRFMHDRIEDKVLLPFFISLQ